MVRVLSGVLGQGIAFLAQFITAARGIWAGSAPEPEQRVYFANHTSNGDFVLIWSVLPAHLRRQVRPVAAADYWLAGPIRRYVVEAVFRAVLIERNPEQRSEDPVAQMIEALDAGASLILFPEGRRNPEGLGPFRTGLFHLAEARPTVALVPVWIENLNRVLPKGEILPVPLVCTVTFGEALRPHPGEERDAFLARARAALVATRPADAGTAEKAA